MGMKTDDDNLCETCQHLGENVVKCTKCKNHSNYDQKDANPFPIALIGAGIVAIIILVIIVFMSI